MKAAAATPECSSLLSLHCVEFITEVELVPEDEQGTKAQRGWSVVCARVRQTTETQS